jgi:hypothetical protein
MIARMRHRPVAASAMLSLLLVVPAAGAARATPPPVHRLLTSKNLWATVDVCNPPDQPNFVGVRGSMPGDGESRDSLYMSFRLQYLDASTNRWIDLSHGGTSEFVRVGAASSPRQGGRSFQLQPVPGKPAVTLRGVVTFQWRRSGHLLASASRPTTAGHTSLAGADPKGFSAASCQIG